MGLFRLLKSWGCLDAESAKLVLDQRLERVIADLGWVAGSHGIRPALKIFGSLTRSSQRRTQCTDRKIRPILDAGAPFQPPSLLVERMV